MRFKSYEFYFSPQLIADVRADASRPLEWAADYLRLFLALRAVEQAD
jgi:hypothetical protein